VPEACAGELRHANAVPGIRERRDRAHRRRPELPLRCFQISGRLVGIGGNSGAAARTDRNTAGHGLLLENDDVGALIMGSMAAMAPAKPKPTTTTSKVSVIKKSRDSKRHRKDSAESVLKQTVQCGSHFPARLQD
jgi:hypothetical protein